MVGELDVEARVLAPVGQRDGGLQGGVVADLVHRADRFVELQLVEPHPVLDHVDHQRGGAQFQERGVLRQVRVADDDVQPAVLVRVGVRFVPRVDDAALERGLQPDLDLDVVGALRELESGLLALGPDADPTGSGDHLP